MTTAVASSRSSARSTAARSRVQRELKGCETPRLFTPPLRNLEPRSAETEKRTLGYAVIDFAGDVLGIDLLPWQRWLLVHMLETTPDGSLRFRTVVVLVARQNGKSTLSIVLSLFFMYVLARQLVIGTAQDLDVAEEIWQGAVDIAEETDELAQQIEQVVKVNGKKSLNLRTGERYKVKAANRRAGRGLSGDLVLLDELREHTSWDAWGAITKTTMARAMALIVALSNAGDDSSVVLKYLRMLAHIAIGNPDGLNTATIPVPEDSEDVQDESLGIFEWSAPPGCALNDRDGWAQANPALGYTITERAISSALRTDPEPVFRTEVLCQWVPKGGGASPFELAWQLGYADAPTGAVRALSLDMTWDREWASIGVGLTGYVDVARHERGSAWVVEACKGLQERHGVPVWVMSKGPAGPLIQPLRDAGVRVEAVGSDDYQRACGSFYDAVTNIAVPMLHSAHPALDAAVEGATTRGVETMVWDRKNSTAVISPLVAVTLAAWGAGAAVDVSESVW